MQTDLLPFAEPERSYDRDKWTARHALVCDLSLIGRTNNEIAEQLGYTPSSVSIILGDSRSQEYVRAARKRIAETMPDIMQRLEFEANECVNVAVQVRDDPKVKEEIRLRAAFGLLDRAGYSPIQQVAVRKMPELPSELADRIEQVARDSKEITAVFSIPRAPEGE